jgi:hypothetical protein
LEKKTMSNGDFEIDTEDHLGAQDLLHGLLMHQDDLGKVGTDLVNIFIAAGVEPDCTNPPCNKIPD